MSCNPELLPWQIVAIHTGKTHIAQNGKREDSARRTKINWKPIVPRRAASVSVSIESYQLAKERNFTFDCDDLTAMFLYRYERKRDRKKTLL